MERVSAIIKKIIKRVSMTYGEYYYLVKYDMRLVDGSWISKPSKIKIPLKMSKDEASIYYTHKFREYWDGLK